MVITERACSPYSLINTIAPTNRMPRELNHYFVGNFPALDVRRSPGLVAALVDMGLGGVEEEVAGLPLGLIL